MELAGVRFTRPLTHDLFNAVVRGLDSTFVRVLITKVVDNTYYASLVFRREDEFISIDARPSDSIALALRAGIPIHAAETLLEASAFEIEETGVAEGEAPPARDRALPGPGGAAERLPERAGSGGLRPFRALKNAAPGRRFARVAGRRRTVCRLRWRPSKRCSGGSSTDPDRPCGVRLPCTTRDRTFPGNTLPSGAAGSRTAKPVAGRTGGRQRSGSC